MPTKILRHISAAYGVDTNNDGFFNILLDPDSEGYGLVASANGSNYGSKEQNSSSPYGSGQRRCGIVFDLAQIPSGSKIVSAMLDLKFISAQGGGSYEFHGFGDCSVTLPSLTWTDKLAGPFPNYVPFPLDVSVYAQNLFSAHSYCAGFSIRNVASVGGQAWDAVDVSVRPDRAPSLTVDYELGGITISEEGGLTISLPLSTRQVRILFGVTNDGGGLIMLPNGHIVRVPPYPPDPFFQELTQGITEFARGLGVRQITLEGIAPSTEIRRETIHMVAKALEEMLQAVKKELIRIKDES